MITIQKNESAFLFPLNDLLTHFPELERPTLSQISGKINLIGRQLENNPQLNPSEKTQLNFLLQQLSEFELGRFLIANEGALSGWWTHYCIQGFRQQTQLHPLEKKLLERAPTVLATRERFFIFQNEIKKIILNKKKNNLPVTIASIPGGMAADLLTLNFPADDLGFVSIDLDNSVASLAHAFAKQVQCSVPLETRCEDAFHLSKENEFDVITSNGLNIYISEREKVVALYHSFFKSLKRKGFLITSSMTPPPISDSKNCEWNFSEIVQEDLIWQSQIFLNLLKARWTNFRTTQEMISILEEAGFSQIKVIPDRCNLFPTFVGLKE